MYQHLSHYKRIWLISHRHDFSSTFDVIVGQLPGNVKRFTVHTDMFTRRSKFFAAARKAEWVAGARAKPVDLSDEDPDVFQAYLNCVYVGPESLEEIPGEFEVEARGSNIGFCKLLVYNICKDVTKQKLLERFGEFGDVTKVIFSSHRESPQYESSRFAFVHFTSAEAGRAALKYCDGLILCGHRVTIQPSRVGLDQREYEMHKYELADLHYNSLIKLYLLADKLRDVTTANIVVDEIERFYRVTEAHPGERPITTAYNSTAKGSPLRKLLRNMWFYDTDCESEARFKENVFPNEFLHDVLKLYMSVKVDGTDEIENFFSISSNEGNFEEEECDGPTRCRYHQHDDEQPSCPLMTWEEEGKCESCKSARKS